MQPEPRILVVSADLMVTSRLAGPAGAAGVRLDQRAVIAADTGPYDLVLLDLQGLSGPVEPIVAAARGLAGASRFDVHVVAFGPHVAGDQLRAAVAAGCDEAVSRGELLGGFATLLRRWLA
jgi:hypothetical protein